MNKTFSDYGIVIEQGQSRTFCPQCSPTRKKSYDKCLSVDYEKGVWFCHHCGWHGGLGNTDKEKTFAKKHFQMPHFVECEITDPKVIKYFQDRGITKATLSAFKIKSGLAWMHGPQGGGEVNSIQFPYFLDGKVVNVKYRTGDKRFRQEKNAKKCFYNYDMAMASSSKTLYICEGEMDALSIYETGLHAVVSVPDGAPSPETQVYSTKFDFLKGAEGLLAKFDWVVLAGDNDAPGKKLVNELANRIGQDKCMTVQWPDGCKDANDVLRTRGANDLYRCLKEAKPIPIDGVKSVDDLWFDILDLKDWPMQGGAEIGWKNAIGKFNVEFGQMTIVTGIPSHGKSTFIDALRVNLWRNYGYVSAAVSPENYPVQCHLAMLIEMYAKRNFYEIPMDEMSYYKDKLDKAFYFIQPERDDEMLTIDFILQKAKSLVYREGVKILVLDPWNEMDHVQENGQREDQYISTQLAKIRRFARVNNIHIFIIAHPSKLQKNKDGQYDPPTAYDIAGGAMWRNKADNILCVYRPDLDTSETEVYVQKIRFRRNGKAGSVMKFLFYVDTSTYIEKD